MSSSLFLPFNQAASVATREHPTGAERKSLNYECGWKLQPGYRPLLTALGHEVIVAHAQKVRLITKSRREDDRLDARTLARRARIDPTLLSPVKHRSAEAQLHLTEVRART